MVSCTCCCGGPPLPWLAGPSPLAGWPPLASWLAGLSPLTGWPPLASWLAGLSPLAGWPPPPAWWQRDGWLGRSAFTLTKRTCFCRGDIRTEKETYYLEPTHKSLTSVHRMYRESDKLPTDDRCGACLRKRLKLVRAKIKGALMPTSLLGARLARIRCPDLHLVGVRTHRIVIDIRETLSNQWLFSPFHLEIEIIELLQGWSKKRMSLHFKKIFFTKPPG